MPPDALAGKYLTFLLAGEEYGIEILRVQEIISVLPVTRVPRTPPFIRGVINLRGKVIPIVDLREKLGLPAATEPAQVMIVVQVRGIPFGIVVDSVSEVASIPASEIGAAPDFGDPFCSDFLLGLGRSGDRLRLLLDIERVLSHADVSQLASLPVDSARD